MACSSPAPDLQPRQDVLYQVGVVVLPVHGRAAAHEFGVCPVAAVEGARLAQQPESLAPSAFEEIACTF